MTHGASSRRCKRQRLCRSPDRPPRWSPESHAASARAAATGPIRCSSPLGSARASASSSGSHTPGSPTACPQKTDVPRARRYAAPTRCAGRQSAIWADSPASAQRPRSSSIRAREAIRKSRQRSSPCSAQYSRPELEVPVGERIGPLPQRPPDEIAERPSRLLFEPCRTARARDSARASRSPRSGRRGTRRPRCSSARTRAPRCRRAHVRARARGRPRESSRRRRRPLPRYGRGWRTPSRARGLGAERLEHRDCRVSRSPSPRPYGR